jgi:hypothetical protein
LKEKQIKELFWEKYKGYHGNREEEEEKSY